MKFAEVSPQYLRSSVRASSGPTLAEQRGGGEAASCPVERIKKKKVDVRAGIFFAGAVKLQRFTSSGLPNLLEMLPEGFLSCHDAPEEITAKRSVPTRIGWSLSLSLCPLSVIA